MKSRNAVVETSLVQVESRWKWISFLKRSSVVASIFSGAMLGFGILLNAGWIVDKSLAVAVMVLLCAAGFLAWMITAMWVAAATPDSPRLANDLERADPRLMDRMATLVHLAERRGNAGTAGFATRIARQVRQLFAARRPPRVYGYRELLPHVAVMLALIAGTFWFYDHYSPWRKMLAAHQAAAERVVAPATQNSEPPDFPAATITEDAQPWGEVRITEPAVDLKVTKLSVVPLEIEAAANQPLVEVRWITSINGGEETPHVLPAPAEPRYAIYNPVINLQEHGLSEWDVMTYYATARTETSNTYASQVYFLEVRPFEEDLLKLGGGHNGKAHEWLSELTSLVQRQQQVIRETHRLAQSRPEAEAGPTSGRELAEVERQLSAATRHLSADLAAGLPAGVSEQAVENLDNAEHSLTKAGDLLTDGVLADAQARERLALSELVAARKIFQEGISDSLEDVAQSEVQPPFPDSSQALKEMAEFRNEANAARDFVQKILQEQRQIQMRFMPPSRAKARKLAVEQSELKDRLDDFAGQHPQLFKDVQPQLREAGKSMDKAEANLADNSPSCFSSLTQAGASLQVLKNALDAQAAKDMLTETYRLKQMLEQQAAQLQQACQAGSSAGPEDISRTAGQARQTLERLRQLVEQEPIRRAFDSPLREALSPENKAQVDQNLARAERLGNPQQQKAAAAGASEALQQICQAFSQSEPALLQAARASGSLGTGESEAFLRGTSELESLLKQLETGQPVAKDDLAKQARQALRNIKKGLLERDHHRDGEPGNQSYAELEQLETVPKDEQPLDVQYLKRLLDQLRRYTVEVASAEQPSNSLSVVNIDPARLPSAYRGRIQKYFEKLSER